MSIGSKLMFWKKKDPMEIDLDKPVDPMPSYDQGAQQPPAYNDPMATQADPFSQQPVGTQPDPFTQPTQDGFGQPPAYQPQQSSYRDPMGVSLQSQSVPQSAPSPAPSSTTDTQLIVAKLETIQASLEHLATRIANLERSNHERKW